MIFSSTVVPGKTFDVPMVVPFTATLDYTGAGSASILNGYLTKPFSDLSASQTIGLKNDLYVVENSTGTDDLKICKADTKPTGSYSGKLLLPNSVYLNESKTGIIEANTGLTVSVTHYSPIEEENFVRVGTVTVTNKVMGSFSASSYANFSVTQPSSYATSEIIIKANHVYNSSYQWVVYPFIFFAQNRICIWTNQKVSGVTNLTSGGDYWIRIVYDGTDEKIYSKAYVAGETIEDAASFNWTLEITTTNQFTTSYSIGNSPGQTSQYNRSTIDLANTRMWNNGTEWWRPITDPTDGNIAVTAGNSYIDETAGYFKLDTDTTYTPPSCLVHTEDFVESTEERANFSQRGSVTVANKIATNFGTATDYLHSDVSTISMSGKPWEAVVKYNLASTGIEQEILRIGTGIMFRTTTGNKMKPILYTSSSLIYTFEGNSFNLNEWNWYKIIFNPSASTDKYTFYYSTNGTTWNHYGTANYSTSVADITYVDVGTDTGVCFINNQNSKVDLSETYLKVDGSVVWTPYINITGKTGYLNFIKPTTTTTSAIVSATRNPTAVYAGSTCTPRDLSKKIWLSTDLSSIIGSEDL